MNYYYPYYMAIPPRTFRPTFFSSLKNSLNNINFNGILNGTQRTLNIINQTIPLVKQISPVIKNAKTMFRVMSEFRKANHNENEPNNIENIKAEIDNENYGPQFFL